MDIRPGSVRLAAQDCQLEVHTSDYYTGDPDHPVLRWPDLDPRRRDFWGHAVVPSWYSEASPVLGLDEAVVPVAEISQAAESAAARVGADGFTIPPAEDDSG